MAISVNGEGYRQVLGIVEGAKKDKAGKPFACGLVIHPVIDGCLQLRRKLAPQAADIRRLLRQNIRELCPFFNSGRIRGITLAS